MPNEFDFVRGMLSPAVVYIVGSRHRGSERCEAMRRDGILCDLTFEMDGKVQRLHRFALQSSGFFNHLFRENPGLSRYTSQAFARDVNSRSVRFFPEIFDLLYSGCAVIDLVHASDFRKLLDVLRVSDANKLCGFAATDLRVTEFGFTPDGVVTPALCATEMTGDMARAQAIWTVQKVLEARENKENHRPLSKSCSTLSESSPSSTDVGGTAPRQPAESKRRKAYTPRRLAGDGEEVSGPGLIPLGASSPREPMGEEVVAGPSRDSSIKDEKETYGTSSPEQPMSQVEQIMAVDYSSRRTSEGETVCQKETRTNSVPRRGRKQISPTSLSQQIAVMASATEPVPSTSAAAAATRVEATVTAAAPQAAVTRKPVSREVPLNLTTPPRLPMASPPSEAAALSPMVFRALNGPAPAPPLVRFPALRPPTPPARVAIPPPAVPEAIRTGFPLWSGSPNMNPFQVNALAMANLLQTGGNPLAALHLLNNIGMGSGSCKMEPVPVASQAVEMPNAAAPQFVRPAPPNTPRGGGAVGRGRGVRGRRSDTKIKFVLVNDKRMVQCTTCLKILADPSSLYRHRKIHSKEKAHSCKFCERTFIQRYNMTQHVKTHFKKKGSNSYMVNNCSGFIPFLNDAAFTEEEISYLHNVVAGNVSEQNTQSNVTNPFTRIRDGSRKRRRQLQERQRATAAVVRQVEDMDLDTPELVMDEQREGAVLDDIKEEGDENSLPVNVPKIEREKTP